MGQTNNNEKQTKKRLQVVKSQDVEFSMDLADEDDLEAIERAEAADKRQDND